MATISYSNKIERSEAGYPWPARRFRRKRLTEREGLEKAKEEESQRRLQLKGSEEMRTQANEFICPIN